MHMSAATIDRRLGPEPFTMVPFARWSAFTPSPPGYSRTRKLTCSRSPRFPERTGGKPGPRTHSSV